MSHRVRNHLRVAIAEYDEVIRQFIPGYEAMLSVAADAVAACNPDRVLDLGAGTGGLSQVLLERSDIGAVELLDVDPEMMEQARLRLQNFGNRAHFTLRSYDEPFPACNAFAASLSLHHIPTIEAKSALYKRIFTALDSGGVFVNADANMPDNEKERQQLYRYWADHMVASGISEERAWQHFEEWAEEDTYLPLEAELAELSRAGFNAECIWKDGPDGVVVAKKP